MVSNLSPPWSGKNLHNARETQLETGCQAQRGEAANIEGQLEGIIGLIDWEFDKPIEYYKDSIIIK